VVRVAILTVAFAAASGIRPIAPEGEVYTYKPRAYRFSSYFANRPGTYHWQAVRTACDGGDCRQEGPVTRFTVR
jgi:hypothetical protein